MSALLFSPVWFARLEHVTAYVGLDEHGDWHWSLRADGEVLRACCVGEKTPQTCGQALANCRAAVGKHLRRDVRALAFQAFQRGAA